MPPLLLQAALANESGRGKKQREANRRQREEQHRQNEQARPEDERLLTRTDLEKQSYRFLSRSTLLGYASIIRFFSEFCEDILHLSRGTGQQYFEPRGPVPDTKMIRQFLFYLADSSRLGRGLNGMITRRTAESHATSFFGAVSYCNKKLEKEIRDQVFLWVRYDLTEELKLNKALGISKPVAHRADLTLVLQMLFSPLGLRQVMSMRVLLNLTIFLNLMVDTCGRIHEIVSTERYPELYLRWKDLQVYVFNQNGRHSLGGILHVGNLKGMKDDPTHFKEIPLSLLPSSLCLEDSLRLLLIAALIDGHIKGARTWADLERIMSLCSSESGQLLPFTEASRDLPLIPAINHTLGKVITESPVKPDFMPRQMKRAGRLCGFPDIFKSHALRRGAAYTLEVCSTAEFRTWAMGHNPGSRTYMNSYKGMTATEDIQAIMHCAPRHDVLHMGSMSLGRAGSAPQVLSPEGLDIVMSDTQIISATKKCTEALDALTLKYPSIRAASEECSEEYQRYKVARDAMKILTRSLKEKQLQKEYEGHVEDAVVLKERGPVEKYLLEDIPEEDQYPTSNDSLSGIDPSILSTEEFMKVSRGDIEEAFEILALKSTEGSEENCDQDEFEDCEIDGSWRFLSQGLVEGLEAQDTLAVSTGSLNSLQEDIPTRLHGVYTFHVKQRHAEGSYYESEVFKPHRHDTIWQDATQPGLTDQEVSSLLLPFFMTMHALERYGTMEPRPSTFICSSCSVDQITKTSFDIHIAKCRSEMVLERANRDWRAALDAKMVAPCDWMTSKKPIKLCEKIFADYKKYTRHVLQHTYKNAREICRFGDCAKIENPPEFPTRDDWAEHLAKIHQLTTFTSSSLVFFCAFCDDYTSFGIAGPSARDAHYQSHMIEALNRIKMYGYNPVQSTARGQSIITVRQPWSCVFCVHDNSLTASERIAICNEAVGKAYNPDRREHLHAHFLELGDAVTPCPASAAAGADHPLCSSTALFRSEQLEEHLVKSHGIFQAMGLAEMEPKPKRVRVRGKALEALKNA